MSRCATGRRSTSTTKRRSSRGLARSARRWSGTRLATQATERGTRQAVLLRVNPAVAARTHEHLQTGAADSKFGLSLSSDDAATGVGMIAKRPSLDFRGLHFHIGSQIGEIEPYRE